MDIYQIKGCSFFFQYDEQPCMLSGMGCITYFAASLHKWRGMTLFKPFVDQDSFGMQWMTLNTLWRCESHVYQHCRCPIPTRLEKKGLDKREPVAVYRPLVLIRTKGGHRFGTRRVHFWSASWEYIIERIFSFSTLLVVVFLVYRVIKAIMNNCYQLWHWKIL